MSYTVKELSKLSGVSPRTLRWYDEIGILKPAYYGQNGYRYYEEEQLLLLQQILFYRELDFSLDEVDKILSCKDFEIVNSLLSQRGKLLERLEETEQLIKTIDKTISYLRGISTMDNQELYYGIDPKRHTEYERCLIENKVYTKKSLEEYKEKNRKLSSLQKKQFREVMNKLGKSFVDLIEKGVAPESEEAQNLFKQHHSWVISFWKKRPTSEQYISLGDLYESNRAFPSFFAQFHPNLLNYLAEGMKVFANNLQQEE